MSESAAENVSPQEEGQSVGQADAVADAEAAGGEASPGLRFDGNAELGENDRAFAEEGGEPVGAADAEADAAQAGADES